MVTLNVNGQTHDVPVGTDDTVVDVLRDRLHLTGTKLVCGGGVCGACTVLLDGEPVAGCLLPAAAVDGRTVRDRRGHRGPRASGRPRLRRAQRAAVRLLHAGLRRRGGRLP